MRLDDFNVSSIETAIKTITARYKCCTLKNRASYWHVSFPYI